MANTKTIKLGLTLAALLTAPVALAYNDFSAHNDCVDKVAGWGSSYSNARDVQVNETGHRSYAVSGLVDDRDGRQQRFDCRIENREVVSWNVSQHSAHEHKKSGSGKALAIGAGVLGVAALLAILASNSSKDAEHDDKRTSYNTGKMSPFNDMRYLRAECARVVRAHLANEHGNVERLDLSNADLNGRTLSGDGSVVFSAGGERSLTFSCAFDRAGAIYDGNYSYRRAGYR